MILQSVTGFSVLAPCIKLSRRGYAGCFKRTVSLTPHRPS